MIVLPKNSRNRATFRILTMPEGTWGSQVWTPLPIPLIFNRLPDVPDSGVPPFEKMEGTVLQGGYHVGEIARWCLPDEDRATFYIDVGVINGAQVNAEVMTDRAIRIQVLNDENFPNGYTTLTGAKWKTVFVGTIIHTENEHLVGTRESGRVTFHCAGTLWRTRDWPLDRHSTANATHAKGNPGYNVALHGWFRKVLGNKGSTVSPDPFGDLGSFVAYYATHAMPVDGEGTTTSKWTDAEVVKHAVVSSRAIGEPLILVSLSAGAFGGTYSWPVSPGDSCWDILRRVCNRQRGRGAVYLDYIDSDDDVGAVTLTLKSTPSNRDPMVYRTTATPGALELTHENIIPAAAYGEQCIDVDLLGDHRLVDGKFKYDNRQSSLFKGVLVQGENIQALVNLNFFGSTLAKRWSDADETAMGELELGQVAQRTSSRWRHVWRRFGVPTAFSYLVTGEPSAAAAHVNYLTDADGDIVAGEYLLSETGLSSELTLHIMSDLPIYEGWRYDVDPPVRYDGAQDYIPPGRMPPVVLYRADLDVSGAPTWFPLNAAGFNLQTDDFGLYIVNQIEESTGVRLLATAEALPNAYESMGTPGIDTAAGFNLQKMNTIVGVELGTRVSILRYQTPLTGAYDDIGRKYVMTINGLHLWLGAPGAMWECDYNRAGQSDGQWNPGLKFPTGKAAYCIRDDRNELSFIAALAWEYYGNIHNPATWGINDCGLLTSFVTDDGVTIPYPKLGQMVGKVTHAGTQAQPIKATLNTNITSIHYLHEQGQTWFRTDYVSYDGNLQ